MLYKTVQRQLNTSEKRVGEERERVSYKRKEREYINKLGMFGNDRGNAAAEAFRTLSH